MKSAETIVRVGGMSESPHGTRPAMRIRNRVGGDYTVLFVGPWTPEKIRGVAEICRKENMHFVMDEMINRLTGELTPPYAAVKDQVLQVLSEYPDVFDGSLIMCEYGGLMFYWPQSTVAGSKFVSGEVSDFQQAEAVTLQNMKDTLEYAKQQGIPGPFVCIEACGVAAPVLYRAGIDRVDLEVTYQPEEERSYSAVKGASLAFGRPHFGVDMAMVWYGGNQHDRLWASRWKISLLHAFLRGADPIYAEHGVMDYKALGKEYGPDHPEVLRFCGILGEAAEYIGSHPRPEGFPDAAVAAVQGRLDGYVGMGQTHLWGRRTDDRFRIGDADRSWDLFEGLYRRRTWENREVFGDTDYSGNPPLGQADVLPFDAPQELYDHYKALFFLGRNSMDDGLYRRLVSYVEQGGQLLMTAAHLNTSAAPGEAFTPYRNGDWTELFGVKLQKESEGEPLYGIKFKEDAPCGWRFPLWSPNCDPKYTDGGFRTGGLELDGAEVLAVGSDRFADREWSGGMFPVITCRRIGKGCAILVNSLDYPGAAGLRKLYAFLLDACCDANRPYPRVESSDRVRYAVYGEGETRRMWLLNTEAALPQTARVEISETESRTLQLQPGEILQIDLH